MLVPLPQRLKKELLNNCADSTCPPRRSSRLSCEYAERSGFKQTSYTSLAEKLGVCNILNTPTNLEIIYHGTRHDGTLLRLCFLKGLLQSKQDYVSYVNADQQAENVGLHIDRALPIMKAP